MKAISKTHLKKLLGKRGGPVKLNIGCGTDYKKGWINIDNNTDNNITKLDLNWDLRNPLPYEDDSVDFIFNEHFFEHLTTDEAAPVYRDLIRVLKPGGVMRIAMPDLEAIVHDYLHVPLDEDPVIERHNMQFIKTRAERMNMSFHWWDHKWLYDWEELVRRLTEAGCDVSQIKRCKINESGHKELRGLETRQESLLVGEVTK